MWNVLYELSFTSKYLRLYKGDLHTHTLASDGVLRVEELAQHSLQNGLDYLAITDHNQMVSADTLGSTLRPYADTRARMDPLPGTCQLPGSG